MLFNSIEFLLFFPAVVLAYSLLPLKLRMYWLLLASYVFYMGWNPTYALLLFFSTAVTFLASLLIERAQKRAPEQRRKKAGRIWLALCLAINLAILFFFKYFDFALENVNALLAVLHRPAVQPRFDVLLPVGISFYIFQALSYTLDVYRGDVQVERNFFRYALFVSFFPQLVAGPIERSGNLLSQLSQPRVCKLQNVRDGLMMMVWGFFQKIVIADRAAIFVNQVFNYPAYYAGVEVWVAMMLFAVQIYCDFAGYSNIAIGAAQVMGINLMRNFRRPYFAVSVADFWRRWHISLSTWFRDYLYIPLGGNRRGTKRKYINLMIVFLVSGLWHGAAWTYVIWGGLNGLYQVIGSATKPLRQRVMKRLGMRTETFSHRLLQILITFLLIDISWIFFRANSISDAFMLLRSLFTFNPWALVDGTLLNMGLSAVEWLVLLGTIGVLFAVGLMQESGICLRRSLNRQELWLRFVLVVGGVMAVLIFGIYGPGFDAAAFIYFQF